MFRRFAVVVLSALVLPASAAQAWTWPVAGPVLRPFSFDRAHPYAAGQHRGVDLAAPVGANVLAPAEGVVTFAGTVPNGGKTVSIETPSGYTATLVHLGSIGVRRGARLMEGAVVGTVGPSGVVDHAEPFVYFGLRLTAEEQGYVDPLTFLPSQRALETHAIEPQPAVAPAAEPVAAPVASAVPAPAAPEATASEAAAPVPAAESPPAEVRARRSQAPVVETRTPMRSVHAQARASERSIESADTTSTIEHAAPARHRSPTSAQRASAARAVARARTALPTQLRAAAAARHVETKARANTVRPAWLIGTAAGVALLGLALASTRAVQRRRARIMSGIERDPSLVEGTTATAQDLGRPSVAVCVGEAPSRPRGRVRGARRHLRALPPTAGERRSDGERHRRARHAGDGYGRPRRRLAA